MPADQYENERPYVPPPASAAVQRSPGEVGEQDARASKANRTSNEPSSSSHGPPSSKRKAEHIGGEERLETRGRRENDVPGQSERSNLGTKRIAVCIGDNERLETYWYREEDPDGDKDMKDGITNIGYEGGSLTGWLATRARCRRPSRMFRRPGSYMVKV